jgi:hypothetical protein
MLADRTGHAPPVAQLPGDSGTLYLELVVNEGLGTHRQRRWPAMDRSVQTG